MLPEEGELLEAFGGVAEEFGLLRDHGNMVGGSILNGNWLKIPPGIPQTFCRNSPLGFHIACAPT